MFNGRYIYIFLPIRKSFPEVYPTQWNKKVNDYIKNLSKYYCVLINQSYRQETFWESDGYESTGKSITLSDGP